MNRVQAYFEQNGLPYQVLFLEKSTATVPLAAAALGVGPELIAKSLTYQLKDRDIMLVMSGTARVSNRKFKSVFGCKAKMMPPQMVLERTGYAVGGVCPFALQAEMSVYLDQSLRDYAFVYPAAGAPNACVRISPGELLHLTKAQWVDVAETV